MFSQKDWECFIWAFGTGKSRREYSEKKEECFYLFGLSLLILYPLHFNKTVKEARRSLNIEAPTGAINSS